MNTIYSDLNEYIGKGYMHTVIFKSLFMFHVNAAMD